MLAPTNAAWHNLDADLLAALTKDPSVVKQVVYYHIIPDFGVLPDLASKGEVNSLEGQPITFSGSVAVCTHSLNDFETIIVGLQYTKMACLDQL